MQKGIITLSDGTLKYGIFVNTLSTILNRVSGVVYWAIVARVLTLQELGLLASLITLVSMSNSLTSFGLQSTIVKRLSKEPKSFRLVLTITEILALLVIFLLGLIGRYKLHEILLALVAVWIVKESTTARSLLLVNKDYSKLMKISLISSLLRITFPIIFVINYGVYGAFFARYIPELPFLVYTLSWEAKTEKIGTIELSEMLKGLSIWFASIFGSLVFESPLIIMRSLHMLEEAGAYQLGLSVFKMLDQLMMNALGVVYPYVSREGLDRYGQEVVRIVIGLITLSILSCYFPFVLGTIYGYTDRLSLASISSLSLVYSFHVIISSTINVLYIEDRIKDVVKTYVPLTARFLILYPLAVCKSYTLFILTMPLLYAITSIFILILSKLGYEKRLILIATPYELLGFISLLYWIQLLSITHYYIALLIYMTYSSIVIIKELKQQGLR